MNVFPLQWQLDSLTILVAEADSGAFNLALKVLVMRSGCDPRWSVLQLSRACDSFNKESIVSAGGFMVFSVRSVAYAAENLLYKPDWSERSVGSLLARQLLVLVRAVALSREPLQHVLW